MHTWITDCPDQAAWQRRIEEGVQVDWRGCWLWTLTPDRDGYGTFRYGSRRTVRRVTSAHRAAWLALVGSIPTGLLPDHLCRVRLCVNPDHLELVTTAENIRRGRTGRRPLADFPCQHTRTPENILWSRQANGKQYAKCRECNRLRSAAANLARRSAA